MTRGPVRTLLVHIRLDDTYHVPNLCQGCDAPLCGYGLDRDLGHDIKQLSGYELGDWI